MRWFSFIKIDKKNHKVYSLKKKIKLRKLVALIISVQKKRYIVTAGFPS